MTTAKTVIPIERFEQAVRRYLETTVPRLMLILDPIPVVLEDWETLGIKELDVPFLPKDPFIGSHRLSITKAIYIDRSDFREVASKDYFRLAPGAVIGLFQVPRPILATSFSKDPESGPITEIRASFGKTKKKPKAFIQWVPTGSRVINVRIHDRLFNSDNPKAAEGGVMGDGISTLIA